MLHLLLTFNCLTSAFAVDAACSATQVKAADGKCYDKVEPAFACQVQEQCTGGSSCLIVFDQQEFDGKVCSCPTGLIVLNAVCTIGQCPEGQVRLKDGSCLAKAAPGEFCVVTTQCQSGSTCVEHACICPEGKTPVNKQCPVARCFNGGNPLNDATVTCSLAKLGQTCGDTQGYVCSRDTNSTTQGLCCSAVADSRCLASQTAVLADDGKIQTCLFLGLYDPICGGGVCTQNQENKLAGGVCCRYSNGSDRCPSGLQEVNQTNGYIQTCFAVNTADFICGTNGRCERDPTNDNGGVCCRNASASNTPSSLKCLLTQTPVLGADGQIQPCLFVGYHDGVCQGGVCTQDQTGGTFFGGFCCRFNNANDRCPSGKTAVNQTNGEIQTCFFVNSNDFICGIGGRCEDDPASGTGVCCK